MYKRIEKISNDIVKLNLPKSIIDKFTVFITYMLLFFIMLPRFIYEIVDSVSAENIFYTIYIIFLIPLLYIFIYNIKNKHMKYKLDFILATIFIIIAFISSLHSFNIYYSLFGTTGRKDGFATMLMYYLIYFNSKNIVNKKDIIKIFNAMFMFGIIQTLYGLMEAYLPDTIFTTKHYVHMAYGFCGNPNFFSTLCMTLSLLGLMLSLFDKDHTKYHIISTIIIYIGLVAAESSGPFLTFVLMLFILLIYIEIKRKDLLKKIIVWLAVFVSLYAVTNYSLIYINKDIYHLKVEENYTISGDINSIVQNIFNKATSLFNINNSSGETITIKDSTITSEFIGSGRLSVWNEVISYIKRDNNIWLGSGPDGLSIYFLAGISDDGLVFFNIDKAHNTYLNVLATTGIFSFIIYMVLIIYMHKETIKSKNKLSHLLLFVFIGYNIQALYNINVIYVSPYLYVILGIMMGYIELGEKYDSKEH